MKRNQSTEVLRLFLMLLIVTEHVIGHGANILDVINNPQADSDVVPIYTWLLYSCCIFAVNCFVFISGFYCIKVNTIKIIKLVIQAYSTCIILAVIALLLGMKLSSAQLVGLALPVTFNNWWFLTDYIILMLISPGLNQFTELYDVKAQRYVLSFLFIILYIGGWLIDTGSANLGYSVPCFIFIYLLGRHIHKHSLIEILPKGICLLIVVTSTVLIAWLAHRYQGNAFIMQRIFAYNNPLVLINAVLVFVIFIKINITINISFFSQYAFGIYLFHDNSIVRELLPGWYSSMGGAIIPLIYVLCISIEAIRQFLVSNIIKILNNYTRVFVKLL